MTQQANPASTQQLTRRNFLKTSAAATSAAALSQLSIERAAHAAGSGVFKIGMIGAGGRCAGAAKDAMDADSDARLVAIHDVFMDRVKGKLEALKKQKPEQVQVKDSNCFDGLDGYKGVIEACDVVLIANAAKFHPLHTMAAIQAGKHVFCEKPHGIDPYGLKMMAKACDLAKQKKLCVVSGLHSRYHLGYQETVKRIHDGAIGHIVAIEENFLRQPYGVYRRQEGWTEMQSQLGNQYHFVWLCGDDVPQSLVHNMDRASWALKEQAPLKCHGIAGRSASFGEEYGDVFDHHSVIYHFPNGVRVYAFCRTQVRCYNEYSSIILGSKGRCDLMRCRIEGETNWTYDGKAPEPHGYEHVKLFEALRKGEVINNGDYMVRSTMMTVMGQISCYTGAEVTWDQINKSDFHFPIKPEDCRMDMEPPAKKGPDGLYPVYVPGVTKLI
ncbi:MAG: Gfo/Idh/MocA family oxidoreductase, partial [Verrucomicrobia bacterium]|nr:Gfo/Idh/MocA family oxidoreductase [Verrucomicrobiota bacterium]